jgi:hypothetical protein
MRHYFSHEAEEAYEQGKTDGRHYHEDSYEFNRYSYQEKDKAYYEGIEDAKYERRQEERREEERQEEEMQQRRDYEQQMMRQQEEEYYQQQQQEEQMQSSQDDNTGSEPEGEHQ